MTYSTVVLCHGCMEPSDPQNSIVSCPKCKSLQYCSNECKNKDWNEGGHSFKCAFIQHLMNQRIKSDSTGNDHEYKIEKGVTIQISCENESFPEYHYNICKTQNPQSCNDSALQRDKMSKSSRSHIIAKVKATGKQFNYSIGDQGKILLFPHEFDSAGSFLIQMNNTTTKIVEANQKKSGRKIVTSLSSVKSNSIILCDIFALEPASSFDKSQHNSSLAIQHKSEALWKQGITFWKKQDFMNAMIQFQKSVDCYLWNSMALNKNDHNLLNSNTSWLMEAMSQPSTIRHHPHRTRLAYRLFFLGMCLNDNNKKASAIKYLIFALQTKIQDDAMNHIFTELMLTFEEMNNLDCARTVAYWSISQGESQWNNIYQRPGFVYCNLNNDEGEMESSKSIALKPFYSAVDLGYPHWCHILKKNYKVIYAELLDLLNENSSNHDRPAKFKTTDVPVTPKHWPKVGERVKHDASVVSNGDWREIVLFGPNATTSMSNSIFSDSIAPRTKELIKRNAPDVVSLCNLGGGEVIFSMLAPHTHISPHCASSNIRLTAHLGLLVPDAHHGNIANKPKCGIRVEKEWYEWKEGEFLVFDDSFEHEVINDSEESRCVLLLRFWHPAISRNKWSIALNDILRQKKMASAIRYAPPL